jgi:membrane associated rhomboid family serine protease
LLLLKDLNRSATTSNVNCGLLLTNVTIFAVYWLSANSILLTDMFATEIGDKLTMIPMEIIHGQRLFTLFTPMFMHAGWFHLLGNMFFLCVFGNNVEDAFGRVRFITGMLFGLTVGRSRKKARDAKLRL